MSAKHARTSRWNTRSAIVSTRTIPVALAGLSCVVLLQANDVDRARTRPSLVPLQERVESWTHASRRPASRPAGLVPGPMDRLEAIHALSGGTRGHERCVTDLFLSLHREGPDLNDLTRSLLDAATRTPGDLPGTSLLSADGRFRIHYESLPMEDRNLDGVPDGVERLASEFSDALADFTHVLDWPPAPPPGKEEDVVDVYVVDLGGDASGSVEGFTVPLIPLDEDAPRGEAQDTADARVFLDASLAAPEADSRAIVVHQMAHVIQLREALSESPWWHEASALWLENDLTGNAAETARSFTAEHSRRASGIAPRTLGTSLESFLWPHYLSRSTGGDHALLRQVWSDMAAVPGNNTLEAMDRVLRRQYGTGLAREIAVFNTWNLFLGQADDGQHYSFGSLLPTPRGDVVHEHFPAHGASLQGPLWPTGSALVQILGDGSPGGIRLRFEGSADSSWDVALIVYPASSPGDARYVPVPIDGDGAGNISIPWRRIAAANLLIQNVGSGPGPVPYVFSIDHDPIIPFDLMSFTVGTAPQGAVLSWSTDGEESLAGWNVYRSVSPLGPFFRINRFLVPAAGAEGRSSGYAYVDTQAEGGLKYYYQLEGVTFEGFTEISHVSGVRLPQRARSLRSP